MGARRPEPRAWYAGGAHPLCSQGPIPKLPHSHSANRKHLLYVCHVPITGPRELREGGLAAWRGGMEACPLRDRGELAREKGRGGWISQGPAWAKAQRQEVVRRLWDRQGRGGDRKPGEGDSDSALEGPWMSGLYPEGPWESWSVLEQKHVARAQL